MRALFLALLTGCGSAAFLCGDEYEAVPVPGPSPRDPVSVVECDEFDRCLPHDEWRFEDGELLVTCAPGMEYVVAW